MTTAELAWLAGLLEGEGAFTVELNNSGTPYAKRRPSISLAMTDEDVVRRAQIVSGIGRVTGPYRKVSGGREVKPQWYWRVRRKADALWLMERLYSYMGQRRAAKIDEILTEFGEAA